jgi:glycosyltransferase involved in cell wall biosynthesis
VYKSEKVNVIMPIYNEERTASQIIRRVLAQKMVDRLIIINDNSKDKSLEIIKKAAKSDKRITYFSNKNNMGKGYSVRKGIDEVESGIIIIQDADLEYYPEDYPKLFPNVKDDTFVLGTRTRHRQKTGHEYFLAKFANTVFTGTFDLLYARDITDINTCYKVFKKSMLDGVELKTDDFLIDMEILVSLVKKGYKVKEVDIRYMGRTYAEGKKITYVDAVKQGMFIVAERFR